MSTRESKLKEFVSTTRWKDSPLTPLAGDASRRRYFRVPATNSYKKAIFMDAPPSEGEDIRPFLSVAKYLDAIGLRPPEIYAKNEVDGFLALEDLGDDLFDIVCENEPQSEQILYLAATDVLIHLAKQAPIKGISDYKPLMTDLATSCYRWYAAPVLGRSMDNEAKSCQSALAPLVNSLKTEKVTILRDFHAQNLLWLPHEKTNIRRVGLLDFQDALTGPLTYDLVSLVTDARRDVSLEIRKLCEDRFITELDLDETAFKREISICSVQRNMRILMIFARMSLHFGKVHYIDLIPRVWNYLMQDLCHPDLAEVRDQITRHLPEPTPETLNLLRDKCGTIPTLL